MDVFSSKLSLGGETTAIGLIVVFLLLIVLILIIQLISKAVGGIDKGAEARAAKKEARAAARAESRKAKALRKSGEPEKPTKAADTAALEETVKADEPQPEDDTELVAVLTAAVAAAMGRPAGQVKIASYKRTGRRSVWANAGRNDQIAGRI